MSLSYSEFPVYIGQVGVGKTAISEVTGYILATQASVNYNTNHSPNRKQGKSISGSADQFNYGGALTADISVDCLLHTGMLSGLKFLEDGNQDNFVSIQLGSGLYGKCYAKDVSVDIVPFAPVTLKANFVSLDPAIGAQVSGDPNVYQGIGITAHSDAVAYGHTCDFRSAPTNVLNNTQSQISFKRSYSRTPVYGIGSINASEMLLDGVEEEININSTGLQNLIDFSGDRLTTPLIVNLCGIGGTAVMQETKDLIYFDNGSRLLNESFSSQGGETLTTSATIKQVKL